MAWRSLLPFGSDVPRRNRADGVNKEVGGALAHFMSRADRQGGLAGLKQHKGLRMIAEFESAPFRPTQDLQLHSSCQICKFRAWRYGAEPNSALILRPLCVLRPKHNLVTSGPTHDPMRQRTTKLLVHSFVSPSPRHAAAKGKQTPSYHRTQVPSRARGQPQLQRASPPPGPYAAWKPPAEGITH